MVLRPLPTGTVAFLIVKSMLLTGFDAPAEQVMYLDRHIKEAELLQAIARVNRTAHDKNEPRHEQPVGGGGDGRGDMRCVRQGVAGDVLVDRHQARHAGAALILRAHGVARALRRDHDHVVAFGRRDAAEVDRVGRQLQPPDVARHGEPSHLGRRPEVQAAQGAEGLRQGNRIRHGSN